MSNTAENKTVKEVLSALPKNEILYYRSNPGNAGDALIALGTFHLFDELGISIQMIDQESFDATGKNVVYAGGGNFNHIYPEAREFIIENHTAAKCLILLPHTITSNEDLLSELGSNVILFARERVSYDHIREHARNCRRFIDHDMALHIDVSRTEYGQPLSLKYAALKKIFLKLIANEENCNLPSIRKIKRISAHEKRARQLRLANGLFFRQDVEASGRPLPENNSDLSAIYELGTSNRKLISYTVDLLLHHINQYETVATDRLHICIAAALLSKPVTFFGNSYFKCRAVYEYSLRNRFPTINWHD